MSLQAYNSATDTLTPIAENDYKDSLEKISALPTASADLLNKCYLLTANQGSYIKGGIYQCQSDGSSGYVWILINGSGVPVDVVEDGNMNAVTSNAVSDKFDTLGTASAKNSTDLVRPNVHDLVESGAVYSAINNAVSSIYTPRGSLTCAELTSSLLIDENVGNVYEMSDAGTTTALFVQGAGEPISMGDNVGIIKAGANTCLFNLMGNAFDLTDYQKKDLTTAVEGATTVEGALGALSTNKATQAEVDDIVNVLGAKNLIPYPYHRQNGYTSNGATFTYNDDGVITVNKDVGSATAYFALFSNIVYPNAEKFLEPNTSYILSMELEDATNTSCFLQIQNGSDIAAIRNKATGKYETLFTTTETIDSLTLGLYYGAEATENNAKVKLMIRMASVKDNTYVPYAKTNKQITDVIPSDASSSNKLVTESDINTVTSGTATNTSYVSSGTCTWVKSGRLVTVTLNNYKTVAYTDGDKNLSTGLPIPAAYFAFNCINPDGGHSQLFSIGTDGILRGGSGTMKAGDYYQSVTYIAQ
jgi:hypothetical protein